MLLQAWDELTTPDPSTNSETTNPNFHEFFDHLEQVLQLNINYIQILHLDLTTLLLAILLRIVCEVLMTFRHENTKSQWYVTNSLGDGAETFLK